MYLTVKQQLNHLSKNEYLIMRELSHIAKNLANEAIYNARLQSIKDKQKIDKTTSRQLKHTNKRNNRVNDYMSKTAKMIINYCIEHDLGNLVVGMNDDFQRSSNIGKRNNQAFVNIPFGKLVDKLEYQCQLNSINFIRQEESYTSKASFFDKDEIPVYDRTNPTNYIKQEKIKY